MSDFTRREQLLSTATEYVTKQRNKSYGEPDEDFQRIAAIATAMGFRFAGRELTGHDVAMFMIALKLSRLAWMPTHEDSWTDIAGYAACGYETAELEAERDAAAAGNGVPIPGMVRLEAPAAMVCGTGCSPRNHQFSGECRYRYA